MAGGDDPRRPQTQVIGVQSELAPAVTLSWRAGRPVETDTPGTFADHDVTLEEGTRLAALLGDHAPVKSHHHQGFGRVGLGLRVAAHAEDGTIEAVEDPSRRFAFGVLWHPEAGEDTKLFEELVRQAREYRSKPAS